jgi:hypothetical protein
MYGWWVRSLTRSVVVHHATVELAGDGDGGSGVGRAAGGGNGPGDTTRAGARSATGSRGGSSSGAGRLDDGGGLLIVALLSGLRGDSRSRGLDRSRLLVITLFLGRLRGDNGSRSLYGSGLIVVVLLLLLNRGNLSGRGLGGLWNLDLLGGRVGARVSTLSTRDTLAVPLIHLDTGRAISTVGLSGKGTSTALAVDLNGSKGRAKVGNCKKGSGSHLE